MMLRASWLILFVTAILSSITRGSATACNADNCFNAISHATAISFCSSIQAGISVTTPTDIASKCSSVASKISSGCACYTNYPSTLSTTSSVQTTSLSSIPSSTASSASSLTEIAAISTTLVAAASSTEISAASSTVIWDDDIEYAAAASSSAAQSTIGPLIQTKNPCPVNCYDAGPASSNWSIYHNLDQLQRCSQRYFLDFSIYDPQIDDPTVLHRIAACTAWGDDWSDLPVGTEPPAPATSVNGTYQVGWWDTTGNETGSEGDVVNLATGLQTYFSNGYAPTDRAAIVFGQANGTTIGIYLGMALQNEGTAMGALQGFLDAMDIINSTGGSLMQYCGEGLDGDHTFGIVTSLDGTFEAVQSAILAWSQAECYTPNFTDILYIKGQVFATAGPLPTIYNNTSFGNSTANNTTAAGTPISSRDVEQSDSIWMRSVEAPNLVDADQILKRNAPFLQRRGSCSTVQVAAGDGCASLAVKCGITGAQFTSYNPGSTFCSTLVPFQHVCCSAGTLPSYAPAENSDGSCASYTVVSGDSCSALAGKYSLTVSQIESYNTKTWAWSGCSNIWVGIKICLSPGTPPFPAPLANAVCGPQVPGTVKPAAGTNISTMNPCLLNACCDVWGQCGTTTEFCVNTGLNNPGTAAAGTDGCISNCGTTLVSSGLPATFRQIAYFEGFNLARPCLNMDVTQIDKTKYTHIHFAFATLSPTYAITFPDALTSYEFTAFAALTGIKRILSIGGWSFSTDPSTYMIFRTGMSTTAGRLAMATSIANFIKAHNLDGVDIDWEYPGAPDIPGIPAASKSDGENYAVFLEDLKGILPAGKTVSICAPASFWYLQGFPIAQIASVIDYIVYMTYDLHGQWDFGNKWSDPSCPGGNCLRSDVNMTETMNALVMITKAGVASNKVVVGVTSYGRAFQMTTPGCYGPMCTYTGSTSGAYPGPCTQTPGYIADAEIATIISSAGLVNYQGIDPSSASNYIVYDNTQWIGYMSASVKSVRITEYQLLNFGGFSDWAVDMESYVSSPAVSWSSFKSGVKLYNNPYIEGKNRSGTWTTLDCSNKYVEGVNSFTAAERWVGLDCDDAWGDATYIWRTYDRGSSTFSKSIANTFHVTEGSDCGSLADNSNCVDKIVCSQAVGEGGGPAGYIIWNSFIQIREMYGAFYGALGDAKSSLLAKLPAFENYFTPLPSSNSEELEIILDLVGFGIIAVAAPFFDRYLSSMEYWINNDANLQVLKDGSYGFVATMISVVKDLLAGGTSSTSWTAEKESDFITYMAEVINAWENVTATAAQNLFNGEDENIALLWDIIQKGQAADGVSQEDTNGVPPLTTTLEANIEAAFFAYIIPLAWGLSGTKAFILDSGKPCGTVNPLPTYLTTATGDATWACYGGELYYLVYPNGAARSCATIRTVTTCASEKFSEPPGLSQLTANNQFGGITLQDLISGGVKTFKANNNKNGVTPIIPTGESDPNYGSLANGDVTTPGFINIPVCGPAEAWSNWYAHQGSTYPNYPCNP